LGLVPRVELAELACVAGIAHGIAVSAHPLAPGVCR
jgi:hypothetical protein